MIYGYKKIIKKLLTKKQTFDINIKDDIFLQILSD